MDQEEEFPVKKEAIRKRFLKYTQKAFEVIPHIDNPRILDIGCGSGIPTLELARLSQGKITGIDINQSELDKFVKNIEKVEISDRVQVLNHSMFDMDFPDSYFDIIWSEGSIYAVGFEKGLREWKRFLKQDGFIVVHDEQENVEEKIKLIGDCGYELLDYFLISIKTWREEYFKPLEKLVKEFQRSSSDKPENIREYNQALQELDMFNRNPERNNSVYFIMKRIK
jgi:ubiquinone/menaquinone biosynthesis C-methylase UbiE